MVFRGKQCKSLKLQLRLYMKFCTCKTNLSEINSLAVIFNLSEISFNSVFFHGKNLVYNYVFYLKCVELCSFVFPYTFVPIAYRWPCIRSEICRTGAQIQIKVNYSATCVFFFFYTILKYSALNG